MRAIMETLFCLVYLIGVFVLSVSMLRKAKTKEHRLFGLLSLILVCGDSFHLIPRIIGLNSPLGLASMPTALGIGKLITSLTMTFFYALMYHFIRRYYKLGKDPVMTAWVWGLAAVRIALCCFPQNCWTSADAPVLWGIYRNIPFLLLGMLIAYLLFTVRKQERCFRFAWLAVVLSFAFYIPVVLWADTYELVGLLMLPKTCCYVWLVLMGRRSMKPVQQ